MEDIRDECECGCECERKEPVCMNACIMRVWCCQLLVCDLCTSQEVLVHTPEACCFCVGERVCITYDGVMTRSIPPQIHASCIRRLNNGCC
ncbi:MAG: hypothetical protein HFF89_05940 [Oscillibacter sp.]|jgi:hypothetical protein|nr:hypothetical protein [Oscillibacter sp.]MCI8689158.1 hypothetical protein [Oscillibacter sp.]MCI8847846.1 hypothetical protein [Oscillibacter sp.]MCI9480763.1 hypothetical protein [Oscillibacter sp.]